VTLRVAIVGDSAMWGQGLYAEHQFARLAGERIAADLDEVLEILPGLGEQPLRGYPRSGAKILAKVDKVDDDHPLVQVLMPSGVWTEEVPGDRAQFALTFRSLFKTDEEMRGFLDGSNERPAARLFGEHPATFPTVTGQLDALDEDHQTADVRLVILNGGINDIDFREVLHPLGLSIEAIEGEIKRIFGEDLTQLLEKARRTFPNAVIVVAGYFAPLSLRSDRAGLKRMLKFMSDKPEWKLAVNDVVQQLPFLDDMFNATGKTHDLDDLVDKAVRRTIFAAARAHFWTLASIRSISKDLKRPNLIYAHPTFLPEHALFSGDRSLFHSGYKLPANDRLSVADEMLETRLGQSADGKERIPRRRLLDQYKGVYRSATTYHAQFYSQNPVSPGATRDILTQELDILLANNSDLPTQVIVAGKQVQATDSLSVAEALVAALGTEIGRIETATIASFLHPNRAGDERYADQVVKAYKRHRQFSVKLALRGMASVDGWTSVGRELLRHGVDSSKGLRQLASYAFVESVAVQLIGLTVPLHPHPVTSDLTSDLASDLIESTFPRLARGELRLGPRITFDFLVPPGGEPEDVLYAFDAETAILLSDVTEVAIRLENTDTVAFQEIIVFLNGAEFFRGHPDQAAMSDETARFTFSH